MGNKTAKKIAVFCLCGLGDAVCTIPGLLAIKKEYSDARISLIINDQNVFKLFSIFNDSFHLIDFTRWDKTNFFKRIQMLLLLRQEKFEIALSRAQSNTWKIPLLIWASGSGVTIGGSNEKFKFLYNRRVNADFTNIHLIDRFLKMVSSILPDEVTFIDWESLQIDKYLNSNFFVNKSNGTQKTAIIIPGCGGKPRGRWFPALKQWPIKHYQVLINKLLEAEWNVLILGSLNESDIANSIASGFQNNLQVKNLCGQTDFRQVLELVWISDMVIGHDSGINHLAAMTGKQVITLMGPTNPALFGPKGDDVFNLWGKAECRGCYPKPICDLTECIAMKTINPEDVLCQLESNEVEHEVIN